MRFLKSEVSSGVLLFFSALLAIFAANNAWLSPLYKHALHADIAIHVGSQKIIAFSVGHAINDGLMAVFFLLVGLEIKRELISGELSNRAAATLPAIAALGGMIAPALIYIILNWEDSALLRGWAIPTATDIAFSLGALALLSGRVPLSVKIFLTAIAVIDDLGAIAVIAFFYTSHLNVSFLVLALFILSILVLLNRRGVCSLLPYMVGFVLLWGCMALSGVHATLAGVMTAATIPLRTMQTTSPLEKLETNVHPMVTYLILPLFAFANSGIDFSHVSLASLSETLPLGIMAGLVIGKSVGITGAVWLTVKLGLAPLPRHCPWAGIVGVALMCGIGFTVSLFIGNLSFTDEETMNLVKIGVLSGSLISGTLGFLLLRQVNFHADDANSPR